MTPVKDDKKENKVDTGLPPKDQIPAEEQVLKHDPNSQDDSATKIEELEEKIRMLALTIDQVEDEKQNIENQLKKALADYRNLEGALDKRLQLREVQLRKQLAESLITLMDDINFGIVAAEKVELKEEAKAWLQGLLDTTRKMSNVLAQLGVSMMELKAGDNFDSTYHEAVAVIPGHKDGEIVEVIQPGYLIDDLVIRPARVVVGKKA